MSDLTWDMIRESVRIDEVVDALGLRVKWRRNHGIWCSCPLPTHSGMDKSPSFSVHESQFVWHCFACDDGGLLPLLVQRIEGLDTWDEALHWLVEYSDADPDDDDAFFRQIETYLERPERDYIQREELTLPYYSEGVLEPYRGLGAPFWESRGLIPHTVSHFRLGFDDERPNGSYVGPAALIPHYFTGKLVGYQERWLDFGTPGFPDWIPKYKNSPDFPRKETLFNFDYCVQIKNDWVYVVESVMTVFRLYQLGYLAVATFGGAITEEHIRLLSSFRGGLRIACDNDSTGWKALATILTGLGEKIPIEVVPYSKGKKDDLGDLADEEIVALIDRSEPGFLHTSAP